MSLSAALDLTILFDNPAVLVALPASLAVSRGYRRIKLTAGRVSFTAEKGEPGQPSSCSSYRSFGDGGAAAPVVTLPRLSQH